LKAIFAFSLALFLIQCSTNQSGGYVAPSGSVMQNTTLNRDIPAVTAVGGRTGEACVTAYFNIISSGDASIKAAAAIGGISTVKSVDYRIENLLGSVYAKTCTIANGD